MSAEREGTVLVINDGLDILRIQHLTEEPFRFFVAHIGPSNGVDLNQSDTEALRDFLSDPEETIAS